MIEIVNSLHISGLHYAQKGEVGYIKWDVSGGTDSSKVDAFPSTLRGGVRKRELIKNKGYYGTIYTQGALVYEPLSISWKALHKRDLELLKFAFLSRSYVIAQYREFKNILARIVEVKAEPHRGTEYWKVSVKIVHVPAFRVYRSTDYGAHYVQASDRCTNEFYDFGFVWSGQVRYRVQYDPPDEPAEFEGIVPYEKLETQYFSRVPKKKGIRFEVTPASISGTMNIADVYRLAISPAYQKHRVIKSFLLTPPEPEIEIIQDWGWHSDGTRGILATFNFSIDSEYPQPDDLKVGYGFSGMILPGQNVSEYTDGSSISIEINNDSTKFSIHPYAENSYGKSPDFLYEKDVEQMNFRFNMFSDSFLFSSVFPHFSKITTINNYEVNKLSLSDTFNSAEASGNSIFQLKTNYEVKKQKFEENLISSQDFSFFGSYKIGDESIHYI